MWGDALDRLQQLTMMCLVLEQRHGLLAADIFCDCVTFGSLGTFQECT